MNAITLEFRAKLIMQGVDYSGNVLIFKQTHIVDAPVQYYPVVLIDVGGPFSGRAQLGQMRINSDKHAVLAKASIGVSLHGIEFHGEHGYLLHARFVQFLQDVMNDTVAKRFYT